MGDFWKRHSKTKLKRVRMRHYANDIILLYRLTEKIITDPACIAGSAVYSLTVVKVDCGGERREVKVLEDISRNREEAYRIFDIVNRGLVTPCTAAEVVGDIIGALSFPSCD